MERPFNETEWTSFEDILPEQVLDDQRRELPGRGTRALMCAVLEEAILCLVNAPPSAGRTRRPTDQLALQAQRWVRSKDQRSPFTFENVCAALNLDANQVRRRLLAAARAPREARLRRSHRVHAFMPLAATAPTRRASTTPA